MDTVSEEKSNALQNPAWDECKTYKSLLAISKRTEQMNTLVDFMLNDKIPIEVKTCQISIQTGQENHPQRPGRFILTVEEHEYLKANGGYYMFIVKNEKHIHGFRMLSAQKVPFKTQWQWDKIITRG